MDNIITQPPHSCHITLVIFAQFFQNIACFFVHFHLMEISFAFLNPVIFFQSFQDDLLS